MIRLERTRDRHVQHLWIGLAYVGAVDQGTIVLVPHVKEYEESILMALPNSLKGRAVKFGIPAEKHLTQNKTKMAKPLAAKKRAAAATPE